jgi:hypothetical protein
LLRPRRSRLDALPDELRQPPNRGDGEEAEGDGEHVAAPVVRLGPVGLLGLRLLLLLLPLLLPQFQLTLNALLAELLLPPRPLAELAQPLLLQPAELDLLLMALLQISELPQLRI